jgi:YVTN family beta-propeller protein
MTETPKHTSSTILAALLFVCLGSVNGLVTNAHARRPGYISPLAVVASRDGTALYIAEVTAKRIAVFDVAKEKVRKHIPLKNEPSGLALSPDGGRLYVTGGSAEGRVYVIDLNRRAKTIDSIAVGHTPTAPVVSPDGRTLYVANRFNNNVSVIDLASGKEVAAIAVMREPIAAGISPDGSVLFVANHLPAGAADQDYVSTTISAIDAATRRVAQTIQLPNGSTGLRGLTVSPDGKHVYATHILARYQLPTTQLERGWMNTNALSVIDVERRELINTVLLDDVDLGAANPWGAACSPDGKYVCVAHAGTDEVSVIDREALHRKLAEAAAEAAAERRAKGQDSYSYGSTVAVPDNLAFLVGLRRRLKLAGNGPRGIVVVGSQAYAAEYFTGSLGVVDLDPEKVHRPRSVSLGDEKELSDARRGEMLFNDADLCFQKWQSCASCHPDARADALNWDLMNDGLGNPKNTKTMVYAHRTPPSMVTGIRPDAEGGVRAGIRFIQFAVRPEEDAAAIDAYLKSVDPTPSPHLVKGNLSESAKRGEKAFEEAQCAKCHPKPLFTDLNLYDVGMGVGNEKDREFDVPTLVEAWRTAPYLYDGRAVTMLEVLKKHNANDAHGSTTKLDDGELADLAEYVLSQ